MFGDLALCTVAVAETVESGNEGIHSRCADRREPILLLSKPVQLYIRAKAVKLGFGLIQTLKGFQTEVKGNLEPKYFM